MGNRKGWALIISDNSRFAQTVWGPHPCRWTTLQAPSARCQEEVCWSPGTAPAPAAGAPPPAPAPVPQCRCPEPHARRRPCKRQPQLPSFLPGIPSILADWLTGRRARALHSRGAPPGEEGAGTAGDPLLPQRVRHRGGGRFSSVSEVPRFSLLCIGAGSEDSVSGLGWHFCIKWGSVGRRQQSSISRLQPSSCSRCKVAP